MATPSRSTPLLDDANLGTAGVSVAMDATFKLLHQIAAHQNALIRLLPQLAVRLQEIQTYNGETREALDALRALDLRAVNVPREKAAA
jgi:hypothetical protein